MNKDSFIAACDDIISRIAAIRKKIRDGETLNNNDLYEINMFLTNYQYYMEKIRYEHYNERK